LPQCYAIDSKMLGERWFFCPKTSASMHSKLALLVFLAVQPSPSWLEWV